MDASTGWVDIETDKAELLALSNLKPGDILYRTLNIAHRGSLDVSYAITTKAKNGQSAELFEALLVTTARVDSGTDCTQSGHASGTQLASSTLKNLSVANANMAAGTAETLCFKLTLPSDVSNSVAGKNTRITFDISSQQL